MTRHLVLAVCSCGQKIPGQTLDEVNAKLARHYRECDGKKRRK